MGAQHLDHLESRFSTQTFIYDQILSHYLARTLCRIIRFGPGEIVGLKGCVPCLYVDASRANPGIDSKGPSRAPVAAGMRRTGCPPFHAGCFRCHRRLGSPISVPHSPAPTSVSYKPSKASSRAAVDSIGFWFLDKALYHRPSHPRTAQWVTRHGVVRKLVTSHLSGNLGGYCRVDGVSIAAHRFRHGRCSR